MASWFSQICGLNKIPKFFQLMKEYHGEGLSVYIILKDYLMSNEKWVLNEVDIEIILFSTPFRDPEEVKEIINRCVELGIFDKDKDGNISSEEIKADLEKYFEGKQRNIKRAEEKAKKYSSQYKFACKDGVYTLRQDVLDNYRIMYSNCDELLKEIQKYYTDNEDKRVYKSRIRKEIEVHLLQYSNDKPRQQNKPGKEPFPF